MKLTYRIMKVDWDEYADDIERLQDETDLIRTEYASETHWWMAFYKDHPIAYCGLMRSVVGGGNAYLVRVGVLEQHRGNALQLRLMRTAERFARRAGYRAIVSDTTDNPPSANNFIRADYRTYLPEWKWASDSSIYWRKSLS